MKFANPFLAVWCAVVVVTCAACGGAGNGGGAANAPANPNEPSFSEKVDAEVFAEKFVLRHVKYPNNASFGWFSEAKHLSEHTWIASGKVTARNAFGADLTHDYEVCLWLADSTWNCRYVMIDGEFVYATEVKTPHELAKADSELKVGMPNGQRASESDAEQAEEQTRQPEAGVAGTDEPDAPTEEPTPVPLREQWRTWTSADGNYTVEARYGGYQPSVKTVLLIKRDGAVAKVKLDSLSEDDLTTLRAELGDKLVD